MAEEALTDKETGKEVAVVDSETRIVGKSGFAALIGRPNVGKSTLMNRLVGQKIAITSKKPQTTRDRIRAVLSEERGQIVFLDTPGLHRAKNKLGDHMMRQARSVFSDADVLCWMVEPDEKPGPQDLRIAESLAEVTAPVFLLINKTDTVDDARLLASIDAFSRLCDFDEVYPLSARNGKGCDALLTGLFERMPEGEPFYDEDTVTDQPLRAMAAEVIREKALHALDQEVPHGIAVLMEQCAPAEDGSWDLSAVIVCEKDSHKGIIIGKKGAMLKKIGTNARYELEQLFEAHVRLSLFVKVKKDWRQSDALIKNFGYRDE